MLSDFRQSDLDLLSNCGMNREKLSQAIFEIDADKRSIKNLILTVSTMSNAEVVERWGKSRQSFIKSIKTRENKLKDLRRELLNRLKKRIKIEKTVNRVSSHSISKYKDDRYSKFFYSCALEVLNEEDIVKIELLTANMLNDTDD